MMRFSSDPSTNIGYCRSKIKLANYSYNPDLIFIKANYRAFSAGALRHRNVLAIIGEYSDKAINAGSILYFLDKPLLEMYGAFHDKKQRCSLNMSMFKNRLNHFSVDYRYRNKTIKLFASLVHCDKKYIEIKADSKWGSGLKENSAGYAAGYYLNLKGFKICMSSVRLAGDNYREDKVIGDIIYKYKKTEIGLSANYRDRNELKASTYIPALLDWKKTEQALIKFKLKSKAISRLTIMTQFQMNALDLYAYSGIIRLSYNSQNTKLILQISQATSGQSDIYYLRPLSASTYSIRKAGEACLFFDLVFEKKFNDVKMGVLVRTEGLSLNLAI
jgi:hypothetical protein